MNHKEFIILAKENCLKGLGIEDFQNLAIQYSNTYKISHASHDLDTLYALFVFAPEIYIKNCLLDANTFKTLIKNKELAESLASFALKALGDGEFLYVMAADTEQRENNLKNAMLAQPEFLEILHSRQDTWLGKQTVIGKAAHQDDFACNDLKACCSVYVANLANDQPEQNNPIDLKKLINNCRFHLGVDQVDKIL